VAQEIRREEDTKERVSRKKEGEGDGGKNAARRLEIIHSV